MPGQASPEKSAAHLGSESLVLMVKGCTFRAVLPDILALAAAAGGGQEGSQRDRPGHRGAKRQRGAPAPRERR